MRVPVANISRPRFIDISIATFVKCRCGYVDTRIATSWLLLGDPYLVDRLLVRSGHYGNRPIELEAPAGKAESHDSYRVETLAKNEAINIKP